MITPRQVKFGAIVIAAGLALFLVYAVSQWYQARSFQKASEQALKAKEAAEKRAAESEGRAKENAAQAQAKEAALVDANARADAADRALSQARNITVSLKQNYDQVRNRPVDPAQPVSVADACGKLAELGYTCK